MDITPKEKAEELLDKMYFSRRYKDGEDYIPKQARIHAKQCALIAVDEIIAQIEPSVSMDVIEARIKYWQEVKNEIQTL